MEIQTLEHRALSNPELMAKINSLDLGPIKYKLMHSDDGEGMTREQVDRLEIQYKRFLYLSVTDKTAPIVPTKELDSFWHTHILDTRKYAEDCEKTFGRFIHHFPYLGLRGDADAELLKSSFEYTKAKYKEVFGGIYGSSSSDCEQCSSCQSSCGVSECSAVTERASDRTSFTLVRPTLEPISK